MSFGGKLVSSKWSDGELIFFDVSDETSGGYVFGVDKDSVYVYKCFNMTKTYATAGDISTYQDTAGITMTLSTALTTGKYLDVLYIGIGGSANINSGGMLFALWVDSSGTGTNNGTYYMARFSVQAGGLLPTAYIQFQTASPGVPYLFAIAGNLSPYSGNAGTYSTADGYLIVSTPGGDRRIALFAGTD